MARLVADERCMASMVSGVGASVTGTFGSAASTSASVASWSNVCGPAVDAPVGPMVGSACRSKSSAVRNGTAGWHWHRAAARGR